MESRLGQDPTVDAQEISQVLFAWPYRVKCEGVKLVGGPFRSIYGTPVIAGKPESPFLLSWVAEDLINRSTGELTG